MLTLALAIGANAATFAIVERVVINPLPYPESDRLITLDHGSVVLKVASGMETTPGLIASVLYGVSPRDPMVFVVMPVTLQVVALAACWIPAQRAAKLDPTIALRAD